MRARFRKRVRVLFGIALFVALLIFARLYFLQVVHQEDYAQKADRQFSAGGEGLFDRGSIYFTRKDGTLISAATLGTGFLVAINPQTLKDPGAAYDAIASVASTTLISRDAFLTLAERTNRVYVEVAHHLSDDAGRALAKKAIPGVEVLREHWRYYPGGPLAEPSVGIVSYGSGDSLSGQTGLEAAYESVLTRAGNMLYRNFFAELFSNIGNAVVDAKDAREGSVVTTIEPEVETRLTNDLLKVTERYKSRGSGGIIMDPSTGEIIALASVPSYDPNDLSNVDPTLLGNPLVEKVHEFGSIMKPLTMASALTDGVVTPRSTYNDTGCISVSAARICNWDHKARGVIPLDQIIVQSLNVGASWLADRLGQDRFRSYFLKAFGQKTGVDLPSETGALLGNLFTKEQVNYDTAAFGQGIAVTPFQMIRALGALANGGAMVRPHLVRAIRLDSGVTRTLDWSGETPLFSADAVRETTTMMDKLDDEVLYGGKAKIPTMSVAVKTGTAQLAKAGGYYDNRFFHSFVGFFPSYAPRFIILLYTDDPKGVEYASETLDTTFLDLVHFLINYYAVPPDRQPTAQTPQ